jgi:sigma-E factor negative regulatory protein RseB
MSLDRETGLLLKTQTISHGHKILETTQFAQLSYTHPVPAATTADIVHEARHPAAEVNGPPGTAVPAWVVGWLPRGFLATDSPLGTSGRRTYTDGLAVFSVFLEVLDVEIEPGEGLVRRGGTTTYTRGMRLAARPVLVTVIGEVPVNTARMVADSVSWVQ